MKAFIKEEAADFPGLSVVYAKGKPPTVVLDGPAGKSDPIALEDYSRDDLRALFTDALGPPAAADNSA